MADVTAIANWIIRLEDDNRHPGIAKNLGDGAGITRIGITSRWHAADVPADFFTTMPDSEAYAVARNFYIAKYCLPLHCPTIDSLELAASLVSFAVNDSPKEAVLILQGVLDLPADGVLGPQTLAEINSKDGTITAKLFRAAWADFYHRDVAAHPEKAPFLAGWLRRAELIYPAVL